MVCTHGCTMSHTGTIFSDVYYSIYIVECTVLEGKEARRMAEDVLRMQTLLLEDFQNVAHGEIHFAGNTKGNFFGTQADILGIYGQNGSGKTALLHAIAVLKAAWSGKPLGNDAFHYIMQGKMQSRLEAAFSMKQDNHRYRLEYSVVIARQSSPLSPVVPTLSVLQPNGADGTVHASSVFIVQESLKYAESIDDAWTSRKTLLEWRMDQPDLLLPKKSLAQLMEENPSAADDLRLAKKLAIRQGSSFLFSDDMKHLIEKRGDMFQSILGAVRHYAEQNLYIIGSRGWGPITMNTGLPFHFRLEEPAPEDGRTKISMGVILFRLDGPTMLPMMYCGLIEKAVVSMNQMLSRVIPGMRLKLRKLGQQLLQDGAEAITLEPVTMRDGRSEQIPLRYESEGIKKLISMLGMFMAAYHSPTMTLAIDELDAGIHEYLLGELLNSFQQGGRGQLIFTSHNLRPLECLDKRSIVFATSDPEERYIRLKNIKANNNLRDVYYNLISHMADQGLYATSEEAHGQDSLCCGGSS